MFKSDRFSSWRATGCAAAALMQAACGGVTQSTPSHASTQASCAQVVVQVLSTGAYWH